MNTEVQPSTAAQEIVNSFLNRDPRPTKIGVGGVGSGTGEQDVEVAQTGIEALKSAIAAGN